MRPSLQPEFAMVAGHTWNPTPDQLRIAKWAAQSVGFTPGGIDAADMQQEALTAMWMAQAAGAVAAQTTIARNACLSYQQRALGRTGSTRRAGMFATVDADADGNNAETVLSMGLVNWETPEAILSLKQQVLGLGRLSDLHQAVLADWIDGDLSRGELASRHGCTFAMVDHARASAARMLGYLAPVKRDQAPRAAGAVAEAAGLLRRASLSDKTRRLLQAIVQHGGRAAAAKALGESPEAIKWALRQARAGGSGAEAGRIDTRRRRKVRQ